MDQGKFLRRLIHVLTPAYLVYYFFPDPLWPGGISPKAGVLLILAIALILELLRLMLRWRILGMREYEGDRISAAAWAGVALAITFLFFPIEQAAPVLFGMALVDPLASFVRRSRWYPLLPLAAYFFISLIVMSILIGLSGRVVAASILAAVIAIAAEYPRFSYVDDDFLMIVAPLIVLSVFFSVTSSLAF